MLLQEHWLVSQLDILNSVNHNMLYVGVSGFGSLSVLSGRPYGGCAILWKSNILATVKSIDVDSRRMCAVCISTDSWKLLLINVYMPYEDGDVKSDEFAKTLSLLEDLINRYSDYHILEVISMLISIEIGFTLLSWIAFVKMLVCYLLFDM